MDKYELKIEQLAQRIRRLEMESLPAAMPVQEVRDMIEELDLVPVSSREVFHSQTLTGEAIMTFQPISTKESGSAHLAMLA